MESKIVFSQDENDPTLKLLSHFGPVSSSARMLPFIPDPGLCSSNVQGYAHVWYIGVWSERESPWVTTVVLGGAWNADLISVSAMIQVFHSVEPLVSEKSP